jgi:hypothetical protein
VALSRAPAIRVTVELALLEPMARPMMVILQKKMQKSKVGHADGLRAPTGPKSGPKNPAKRKIFQF